MQYNKKVAFVTLGCKVNQYETENIKRQFIDNGYIETSFDEWADVYVVNSCTVTNIADRKTRNMIRRTKKINPKSAVVVTGCYAQTNAEEVELIEEVDIIAGNTEKGRVYELTEDFLRSGDNNKRVENIFNEKHYQDAGFSTYREMARAYIKIQDGCDNFCSYCKIPFARGHKRSREIDNIIKEAEILAGEGYKEVILIGINIGAYGEDKRDGITLEDVIEKISEINGIERIRIGSIYPDRINKRLIDLIADNKKMMPHIHISLQSGDDEILRLMKRSYSSEEALKNIQLLRENVKNISFTGDIITGFPGEKEENFINTYKFVEKIQFADIHIFQYSDRENTVASKYTGKISAKVKKDRADELEKLRKELFRTSRKKMIDTVATVLVEEIKNGTGVGYTGNYIKTLIKDYSGEKNRIVNVRIVDLEGELLISEEEDKG